MMGSNFFMGIPTSSAMISVVQMRADQFQEHQRRISSDRRAWSMEKGGSLRGKLYDKYMEKRVERMRMEQRSKTTVMNEEKLRALRDDLERWRMELQGMVVSSRDGEVGVGARRRRRIQKLESIDEWSNKMTEELRQSDILRPKASVSARDDSLVRNRPSASLAQPIVLPVPRSSSGSSRLQLSRENAKPPPVIKRKTNDSIARSSVRTRNASEGLQKSRSSMKKSSSMSPLGDKRSTKGKAEEWKKERQSSDDRYWMSFSSEYLAKKANNRTVVLEQRNGMNHSNESFLKDAPAMRFDEEESESDRGLITRSVAPESPKDSAAEKAHEDLFVGNIVNRRSSQESDDSRNFESTDDDSSGSLSCVDLSINSASELPNYTVVIQTTCEPTLAAGDVESLVIDTDAIRRKIRIPPKSFPPAADSQMGISKFCKRSRGNESSADCASTTTSEEEIFSKAPSMQFSIPSPLETIKQKGGHLSRTSLKATRSFLSLSSLRCRRDDTNPIQPIPLERIARKPSLQ